MQERHNLSFKKLVITMKCGANVQDQIDISARLLYHQIVEGFHTCSESPHFSVIDWILWLHTMPAFEFDFS